MDALDSANLKPSSHKYKSLWGHWVIKTAELTARFLGRVVEGSNKNPALIKVKVYGGIGCEDSLKKFRFGLIPSPTLCDVFLALVRVKHHGGFIIKMEEKTIEQICNEELEEFRKMSKKGLIEEIYRLRFCLVRKNCELIKLRKEKK